MRKWPVVAGLVPLSARGELACPQAIVAARAAVARLRPVRELRPRALPVKLLTLSALGLAVNVPFGAAREHTRKFSPAWFVAVHASIPFIAMLRKGVVMHHGLLCSPLPLRSPARCARPDALHSIVAQRITVLQCMCLLQVLLSTQLWDVEVVLGARTMSVMKTPHMLLRLALMASSTCIKGCLLYYVGQCAFFLSLCSLPDCMHGLTAWH